MLPIVETTSQFQELDLRHESFLAAARAIAGPSYAHVTTPTNGSLPVVLLDQAAVIKFFPPLFFAAHAREVQALKTLVSVSVPRLIGQGEYSGWRYVFMTQLPGGSLKASWDKLTPSQRERACFQTGEKLKELHDLSVHAWPCEESWETFLQSQLQNCVEHQKSKGLSEAWLNQIPDFLASTPLIPTSLCLLHTEIMREHVFATAHGDVTGFIDFEPSMLGFVEYDFASVGLFLSRGDPRALRSFFLGYGNLAEASRPEFRRRIMAFALLHRYSRLKWYLEFMPEVTTLEEAADRWWAID
jgi:hygromycin-B 7''-O-kinase